MQTREDSVWRVPLRQLDSSKVRNWLTVFLGCCVLVVPDDCCAWQVINHQFVLEVTRRYHVQLLVSRSREISIAQDCTLLILAELNFLTVWGLDPVLDLE